MNSARNQCRLEPSGTTDGNCVILNDQKLTKMNKPFLLLVLLISACSAPKKEQEETKEEVTQVKEQELQAKYLLAISEIDNRVNVLVNDSLIFDSGTIHNSPEVNFKIDLTPYVITGDEEVKLKLLNGLEPYEPQADAQWEVRYDLIVDGEIVDFVHEYDDDGRIGEVFETTYIINEWME